MTLDEQLRVTLFSCSKEQLNSYLNDENALRNLVNNFDKIKLLQREKYDIDKANKDLANLNLSKEPLVESLKAELVQVLSELEKVKEEYFSLVSKMTEANNGSSNDLSLEAVYTMLQTSANKSEEETEQMADEFFSNENKVYTDDELTQFHRMFLELRAQAHLKKIKADKMKELMNNGI